ncbi:hypothetical protein [Cellulophaga baltica]|uniref:hypothetical protein n=1 Tax=Cellulophaga baltica TaxID=76594 RepID=UPI00040FC63E|nr:hypothetical protein [Cellulophaga baltica]AIY13889.1 hypothetical protein M667_12085 [Cellulophaga baltica NN016038]
MGKLTINSVSDSNVSYEGVTTEMDEFIPLVSLRDPQKYNTKNDELLMDMDENGNPVFVDLLSETVDSQVNEAVQAIITKLEKPIIPFTVKKGGPDFTFGKGDDDGYISLELSLEKDKYVEVEGATASIKLKDDTNYSDKVLVKWEDKIDVEIDITTKNSIEFYIRFLANDDKDRFEGDYENLFCGCFKVVTKIVKSEILFYSNKDGEYLGKKDSDFKNNRTILISASEYNSLGNSTYLSKISEDRKLKNELFKFDWSRRNNGGLPSLGELIHNYPTNVQGSRATPSSDSYAVNQCAIRLSFGLILSKFDISLYPNVNKTSEGYARSSYGFAVWLHNNVFLPQKFKNPQDFNMLKAHGIIFLWDKTEGGVSHIDIIYYGQTGSGYYGADEIWYWELK